MMFEHLGDDEQGDKDLNALIEEHSRWFAFDARVCVKALNEEDARRAFALNGITLLEGEPEFWGPFVSVGALREVTDELPTPPPDASDGRSDAAAPPRTPS